MYIYVQSEISPHITEILCISPAFKLAMIEYKLSECEGCQLRDTTLSGGEFLRQARLEHNWTDVSDDLFAKPGKTVTAYTCCKNG